MRIFSLTLIIFFIVGCSYSEAPPPKVELPTVTEVVEEYNEERQLEIERIKEEERRKAEERRVAEIAHYADLMGLKHQYLDREKALKYSEIMLDVLEDYDFDPLWIISIMWVESTFRDHVVSHAGAVGLVQIMPSTAAPHGISREQLFDPSVNVEFGVMYLDYLVNRYDSLKMGTVAYNQGTGNIARGTYNTRYYSRVNSTYRELKVLENQL